MGRPCRRRSGSFAGYAALHAETIFGAMRRVAHIPHSRCIPQVGWVPTSRKEREKWGTRGQLPAKPESFLLLAHLSGDVVAELLLDILLGLGIEVGHVKHPANFDHFVILSGDARGPFERLFARLHLDDP